MLDMFAQIDRVTMRKLCIYVSRGFKSYNKDRFRFTKVNN